MKRKAIISVVIMFISIFTIGCVNTALSSNPDNNLQDTTESVKSISVDTKTLSDNSEELESNILLPILSGGNSEELLNDINRIIEEDALEVKEEIYEMAKEDVKALKEDGIELKYQLMINHDIHTANNELISLTTLNYQYTGGAHGLSVKVPYNFDLTNGKEINLKDLFKEDSNYIDILNEEIQKQIQQNPDRFFPDEVELFSGINKNQSFYIKDGKLFIYFGQYEIAPYASGIIEFEIPSSVLKNVGSSSFIK